MKWIICAPRAAIRGPRKTKSRRSTGRSRSLRMTLAVDRWPLAEVFSQRPTANGQLLADRALFDALLPRGDDHAMHEDAGRVDAIGIERSWLHQLLHLSDAHLARGGSHRIEIARCFSIHQVAEAIAFPRGDEGEVADDAAFHHVIPPVKFARFLPLGHDSSVARRREERGDPRPARPHP